jgi:hypothetical protein
MPKIKGFNQRANTYCMSREWTIFKLGKVCIYTKTLILGIQGNKWHQDITNFIGINEFTLPRCL